MAARGEPSASIADRSPVAALPASNAVSAVGNAASTVALAWFVLQTTGSAALMGVAAAVMSIGGAVSSVLGGPLGDRFGVKRASVTADVLSAVAVGAIPILHLAGVLQFAGAGIPVGSILAGVAVESVGIVETVAVMGLVYVAAVLAMFANPAPCPAADGHRAHARRERRRGSRGALAVATSITVRAWCRVPEKVARPRQELSISASPAGGSPRQAAGRGVTIRPPTPPLIRQMHEKRGLDTREGGVCFSSKL